MLLVLDGDAEPHVGKRPGESVHLIERTPPRASLPEELIDGVHEVGRAEQRPHPSVSLREHLECVLRCQRHGGEHAGDVLVRHGLMEQVGQGVDEHPARFAPPQGLVEPFGVQPDAG